MCLSFLKSCRASGPSETRRHHIHGRQVRQCHHPVDSSLHILLSTDICSTVWDNLIHNSSSTDSEEEVMTYSVELSGLRDNTTYYVQVLATNTAQRSNRSTIHTFTLLIAPECLLLSSAGTIPFLGANVFL